MKIKLLIYLFIVFVVNSINALDKNDPLCLSIGQCTYGQKINIYYHGDWNGQINRYSIGSFCSLAEDITFFLVGNHRVEWITTYPFHRIMPELADTKAFSLTKGNIIIGNDVWIGSCAKILSGVTIGDGSVVGAYTVVAKNVPPYSIVVGNPAKIIRYRFSEDQIKSLLKIRWWDWPIEKIKENADLLCSQNIEIFIKKHS